MIPFHRFLIGTAIAFCAGMAWWSFSAYRLDGDQMQLAIAIVFVAAGAALSYYLKHLQRFLHPGSGRSWTICETTPCRWRCSGRAS